MFLRVHTHVHVYVWISLFQVIRDKVQQESLQKSVRISELEQDIEQLRAELQECRQEICENESQRRKLHNTIQELKGTYASICVYNIH